MSTEQKTIRLWGTPTVMPQSVKDILHAAVAGLKLEVVATLDGKDANAQAAHRNGLNARIAEIQAYLDRP